MADETYTLAGLRPASEPPPVDQLTAEQLRSMYRAMVLVRVLDQKMVLLQRQGRIHFYGPITGQEASTLGAAYAIQPGDWLFPALREAGAALVRGLPLRDLIAQCFGNDLDVTRGRQMPCHYVDMAGHYYAMSSSIGSQIPHAAGCAHASLLKGDGAVTLGFMGDGATSEGDFHAAMNYAGVFRVPCVFVCQNNHWAITVPFRAQTASETIAQKAEAYGFEGVRCDGNDILGVYETVRRAVEKARAGGGPTLVECVTYRVLGHSTSDDPRRYRDEAEVAPWRERDPIDLFRAALSERGLLDDAAVAGIETWARGLVDETIEAVEDAPPPPLATLIEDVTKETTPRLHAQLAELERAMETLDYDPLVTEH